MSTGILFVTVELILVIRHFAQGLTYRGSHHDHNNDYKVWHSGSEFHSRARQTKMQLCDFGHYF